MLTERQLLILQAIVDDYIRSAEPVGSRTISKREGITYSAATIRNEMADLEELGFLEKPHSSAGRVPSQQGYRFYVDHLLMPHYLTNDEQAFLRSQLTEKLEEIEDVIEQSAKILSAITSYSSVVLGPEIFETNLKHVQIIPLSKRDALIILITDTGHIEKHTMFLPDSIDVSELEKIVNILNERLKGVPIYKLRSKLHAEVAKLLEAHVKNFEQVLAILNDALTTEKQEKVFYGGKTNLLIQPEFRDIEKARLLYSILEEDSIVERLFRTDTAGIHVKIGHENELEAFENCSIITASYTIGGEHMGTIGILGPTRMEYRRVIGIIDHFSKDLTKLLTHLYQKE